MKKLLLILNLGLFSLPVVGLTNQAVNAQAVQQLDKTAVNINKVKASSDEVSAIIYLLSVNHETLAKWNVAFDDDDKNLNQIISSDLNSNFAFASNLPDSKAFIITNLTDIMVQIFYLGSSPYNPDTSTGLPSQDIMSFDKGHGIKIYIPKFEHSFFVDDTSVKSQ